MRMGHVLRRLRANSKGSVLVETAFVSLLLMLMVIGMGLVAVAGQDLEYRGRVAREAGDYAQLYARQTGGMDADGAAAMGRLAGDRLRARPDDFRIYIHHLRRHPETGAYESLGSWSAGAYEVASGVRVETDPAATPGIHAGGEVLGLDVGEDVWLSEAIVRSTGIPKGTRAGTARRTWAVVPGRP